MKKYKVKIDNSMKWEGDTDTKKKIIRINKKMAKKAGRGEVLDTLEHEAMHAKHPRMHEKTVYKKTPKVVKKMSKIQKSKMYGSVAKV